jgi:DNA-binding LacI/PurR family transcriptional regulator
VDAGISLDPKRIEAAAFTFESGKRAMTRLMKRDAGFTALICGNDVLAIGAIHQCRQLGVRVPQDLSVVGFDDIDMAEAITPPLSTVKMPSGLIGREAGRRLLARLSGESVPVSHTLSTELIFRDTVSPLR